MGVRECAGVCASVRGCACVCAWVCSGVCRCGRECMGVRGCARVCTGVRGYAWVWDVFSEFLLENRVPTSADFNTFPIRIFYGYSTMCIFILKNLLLFFVAGAICWKLSSFL